MRPIRDLLSKLKKQTADEGHGFETGMDRLRVEAEEEVEKAEKEKKEDS